MADEDFDFEGFEDDQAGTSDDEDADVPVAPIVAKPTPMVAKPKMEEPKKVKIRKDEIQPEEEIANLESKPRYALYNLPAEMGIMDSTTKRPLAQSTDALSLIIAAQVDILNRIDKIEKTL